MSQYANLHLSDHPLIAHKMSLLRNKETNTQEFRRLLKEISFYLGYEATRSLHLTPETIITPMNAEFEGAKIADSISIVPILRAGLGMTDALLELIPRAAVHHIGMYRSKGSLLPVQYYNRLPRDHVSDVAFITDPCIATSNTLAAVISIVKRWGAKKIIVIAAIASRVGLTKVLESHPDVDVFIASIDEQLGESGMILPGIGDAGDRLFGTEFEELPGAVSEAASPSKRPREEN